MDVSRLPVPPVPPALRLFRRRRRRRKLHREIQVWHQRKRKVMTSLCPLCLWSADITFQSHMQSYCSFLTYSSDRGYGQDKENNTTVTFRVKSTICQADLYFIWVNKYQQCHILTYYSHCINFDGYRIYNKIQLWRYLYNCYTVEGPISSLKIRTIVKQVFHQLCKIPQYSCTILLC